MVSVTTQNNYMFCDKHFSFISDIAKRIH